MAAAITDKFKKGYGFFSTTLSAQKNSGASSMSLSDATGVPTTTGLVFTVGRVNSSGTSTPSTRAIYKGTLSGTTVSNLTLTEGTDQTHAAGTVVEITFTATHWNDAVDGIVAEHNQDGTHAAITATSINNAGTLTQTGVGTFATHIDVNDASTAIRDSSDNELLKFAKTASAVNEVTITNAATGNAPRIGATGETNTPLDLRGNGTGGVLTELRTQAIDGTTNATTPAIRFQVGTGYVSGDATESSTTSVTFPTAFTTPLGVVISNNGELADANPTSITDGTSGMSDTVTTVVVARSVTTTGFVAVAKRTAASNGKRQIFSWIAWGV